MNIVEEALHLEIEHINNTALNDFEKLCMIKKLEKKLNSLSIVRRGLLKNDDNVICPSIKYSVKPRFDIKPGFDNNHVCQSMKTISLVGRRLNTILCAVIGVSNYGRPFIGLSFALQNYSKIDFSRECFIPESVISLSASRKKIMQQKLNVKKAKLLSTSLHNSYTSFKEVYVSKHILKNRSFETPEFLNGSVTLGGSYKFVGTGSESKTKFGVTSSRFLISPFIRQTTILNYKPFPSLCMQLKTGYVWSPLDLHPTDRFYSISPKYFNVIKKYGFGIPCKNIVIPLDSFIAGDIEYTIPGDMFNMSVNLKGCIGGASRHSSTPSGMVYSFGTSITFRIPFILFKKPYTISLSYFQPTVQSDGLVHNSFKLEFR